MEMAVLALLTLLDLIIVLGRRSGFLMKLGAFIISLVMDILIIGLFVGELLPFGFAVVGLVIMMVVSARHPMVVTETARR